MEGAASRRLPFRFQNSESSDATKETSLKDKEGKMQEYCFVTKKKKKKDLFTNKGYILMVNSWLVLPGKVCLVWMAEDETSPFSHSRILRNKQ